jgi:hypothetical protein
MVFTTWQKHVTAYCGHICRVLKHAHVCVANTSVLTWQSMLWLSFTFLTVLHTSAALVISHTYAVAQANHIYRVLKCAQVCMTNIDPHLCCSPRLWRLRSFPNASQTFFFKWRMDKVFQIHCNPLTDQSALSSSQETFWRSFVTYEKNINCYQNTTF